MRSSRLVFVVLGVTLMVLLSAASCDDGSISTADGGSTPDGEWVLQSLTVDGAVMALPTATQLGLTIDGNSVRGSSGCNSFNGNITLGADGALTWGDVASTEMGCLEPGLMDFESQFQQRVFTTDTWAMTDGELRFTGGGADARYVPKPVPASIPLESTVWTLDTIFSGSGASGTASTPDRSQPDATMVLSGGTITLMSEDCGEFSFPMVYEPGASGSISTPPNVRIGRPDCVDSESNLLVVFFGVMGATEWQIETTQLTFTGSDGPIIGLRADQ